MLVPAEVLQYYFGDPAGHGQLVEIVQLMFVLRSTAQSANEAISSWLAAYDLSATTYNVLAFLGAGPGSALPMSALSAHLHTRATNVTAIVDSLERRGFVRRKPNPKDRRSTLAVLTPRGRAILRKAMPVQHEMLERVFAPLSADERASLTAMLTRVNHSLRSSGSEREIAPA